MSTFYKMKEEGKNSYQIRILMDSHYQLQPNLFKLYEPDAGSNDMFFDGNKHHEKLTLDHEMKRLKFTCEAIDKYSKRKFSED